MRIFILISLILAVTNGIELTFELPDNANQCFYEDIQAGTESVFEFQVSNCFVSLFSIRRLKNEYFLKTISLAFIEGDLKRDSTFVTRFVFKICFVLSSSHT